MSRATFSVVPEISESDQEAHLAWKKAGWVSSFLGSPHSREGVFKADAIQGGKLNNPSDLGTALFVCMYYSALDEYFQQKHPAHRQMTRNKEKNDIPLLQPEGTLVYLTPKC